MQIELIGEYEVTLTPGGAPALTIHHLIRGHDVATMSLAEAHALRDELAVSQKRIREIGGYRAIFGGAGDLTLYSASGARACYLNGDQTAQLGRLLAAI
jgi:hypothetical protein